MNNLKYFPFERNRYFYGKLLSVDDFDTEQRYMNDKRRLINRLLHGSGVVCGLQVVEVDDLTISVEMGVALDFSGREIVVPEPVTRRLSAIDGFAGCEEEGNERGDLYLGIVYEEKVREPVHNIAGTEGSAEEEFNRYEESYRLFVTADEPEREGDRRTALYESTKTVYHENGLRIRQTVPVYVRSGEEGEFEIIVEKTGQTKPVSFSYELRLSGLESEKGDTMTIAFNEADFAPANRYVWRERFRARAAAGMSGSIKLVPDSFVLTVEDEMRRDRVSGLFSISITEGDIRQTMIQDYYRTAMEDILQDSYREPVYLARLQVIRAGDTYVIEEVENLPCRQYVWNHMLTAAMETMRLGAPESHEMTGGVEVLEVRKREELSGASEQGTQVRTGGVWIRLGMGGVEGECYYSGEISHGLGPGEVFLSLGISQGRESGGTAVFGKPELFEDIRCPRIELAAKADMGRGTFVVALKCLEQVPAGKLRVNWMAVRGSKNHGMPMAEADAGLMIRPDVANLRAGEQYRFEAHLGGCAWQRVEWSVEETDGGSIDEGGCYISPGRPGVYKIFARNQEDRSMTAVAFAIVKSRD